MSTTAAYEMATRSQRGSIEVFIAVWRRPKLSPQPARTQPTLSKFVPSLTNRLDAPGRNFGIQRSSQSGATIRPVTTYSNRIARNAHLPPPVVVNAITSSPARSPRLNLFAASHSDLAFSRNDAALGSLLSLAFRPFPFFHSLPRPLDVV